MHLELSRDLLVDLTLTFGLARRDGRRECGETANGDQVMLMRQLSGFPCPVVPALLADDSGERRQFGESRREGRQNAGSFSSLLGDPAILCPRFLLTRHIGPPSH